MDPRFSDPTAVPVGWEETRRLLETAELFWLSTVRLPFRDDMPMEVRHRLNGSVAVMALCGARNLLSESSIAGVDGPPGAGGESSIPLSARLTHLAHLGDAQRAVIRKGRSLTLLVGRPVAGGEEIVRHAL